MAGNRKTGVVLQPRDLRLIEALRSMRVISREQAKVIGGFGSVRRTNDRLLALTRAGILKRAFIGTYQAVYWPSDTAISERGHQGAERSTEPTGLFLKHRLEINRVQLLVQYQAIPTPGWWFAAWHGFLKPLSETMPLIPDGYFEIGSRQGVRPHFLEIDLGTEAVPVLAKKANAYLQLATTGEFERIFKRTQFRVLVITTSRRRLDHIRQAILRLTDKIFWFATLEVILPESFWSASWLRASGDQMQSLL